MMQSSWITRLLRRNFSQSLLAKSSNVLKDRRYQVTTYSRPENVCITRGKNAILYDDINGREYIDFTAGIAVTALGHSNPQVAQILYNQANKLIHSSNLYYSEESLELGRELIEQTHKFGGQWDAAQVFMCNSGTEANEAALKFAKKIGVKTNEKKQGIIAFQNSFHGRTMGALSVTSNPKYRLPFGDLIPNVSFLSLQDELSVLQDYIAEHRNSLAGLIVEPIQGEGGIYPVPTEKLIGLKEICHENDLIVIYDEIQCGLGRTGKLWAHSHLPKEAHPDIFTSAKALGNGFPIAATIVNEKVNNALEVGDHGTTYGGNPLGCAVGRYVLSVIADESMLSQVNRKGKWLMEELDKLKIQYPKHIKQIRGKGLMLGMELNDSPSNIIKTARDNGLLIISAGKKTLRFVPALTIDNSSLKKGLNILKQSLAQEFNH